MSVAILAAQLSATAGLHDTEAQMNRLHFGMARQAGALGQDQFVRQPGGQAALARADRTFGLRKAFLDFKHRIYQSMLEWANRAEARRRESERQMAWWEIAQTLDNAAARLQGVD